MKYQCNICQWIYDEDKEQTKFEDLKEDWVCPLCGASKESFDKLTE